MLLTSGVPEIRISCFDIHFLYHYQSWKIRVTIIHFTVTGKSDNLINNIYIYIFLAVLIIKAGRCAFKSSNYTRKQYIFHGHVGDFLVSLFVTLLSTGVISYNTYPLMVAPRGSPSQCFCFRALDRHVPLHLRSSHPLRNRCRCGEHFEIAIRVVVRPSAASSEEI